MNPGANNTGSLFGSNSSAGGPFGASGASNTSNASGTTSTPLFGSNSGGTTTKPAFGASSSNSGSVFGSLSGVGNTSSNSSLFAKPAENNGTNAFGASQSKSTFGNFAQNTNNSKQSQTSSSIFGSKPTETPIFGTSINGASSNSNVPGAMSESSSTQNNSNKPTFGFGSSTADTAKQAFGSTATTVPSFNFGNSNTATGNKASSSLFTKVNSDNAGVTNTLNSSQSGSFGQTNHDSSAFGSNNSPNNANKEGATSSFSFGKPLAPGNLFSNAESNNDSKSNLTQAPSNLLGSKTGSNNTLFNTKDEKGSTSGFGTLNSSLSDKTKSDGSTSKPTISLTKDSTKTSGSNDQLKTNQNIFGTTTNFTFGKTTDTKGGNMLDSAFGKSDEAQKNIAKPAFSFGNSVSEESGSTKPAFSFGQSGSGKFEIKQGQSNPKNINGGLTKNEGTPSFSFGKKDGQQNDAAKPAINLTSNDNTSKSLATTTANLVSEQQKQEDKSIASKSIPADTGNQINEKHDNKIAAFSFGNKSDEQYKVKPATNFSFGKVSDASEDQKPSLNLSSAQNNADSKNDKPAPAFSFGAKKGAKTEGMSNFSIDKQVNKDSKGEVSSAPIPKPGFDDGAKDQADNKSSSFSKPISSKNEKETKFSFGTNPSSTGAKKKEVSSLKNDSLETKNSAAMDSQDNKARDQDMNFKKVDPKPVSLDNKTLDDLITSWTSKLSTSALHFDEYAMQVKKWDQVLVKGGEQISQLYSETLAAEKTQNRIDSSLQYIERQQDDLESFLDNYETKIEAVLSDVLTTGGWNTVNGNDQKRQQAYKTAEDLDENLGSLSVNLSSLINEINEVSSHFNKASSIDFSKKDESAQLVRLLNSHLDALQVLDSNASSLEQKIQKIQSITK